MKSLFFALVSAAALTLPFSTVFAAPNAADSASNYVGLTDYRDTNRGTGYGTAFTSTTTNSGTANTFLGSSPEIDTNGLAFGLYGNGGSIAVTRTFAPAFAGVINAGQTFSLQLQPASITTGGTLGFDFRSDNSSTGTRIAFRYDSGATDYNLTISRFNGVAGFDTTTIDTGVPFSTHGLTVAYTQNPGTFTLRITPLGGTTTTLTQTSIVGEPFGFDIFSTNATLYFNQVMLVPEPGTWLILALGLLGGGGWYLRRRTA